MPMIDLKTTAKRFLHDRSARLAFATTGTGSRAVRGWQRTEAGEQASRAVPLLFTGLFAALYVTVRVGLTYFVTAH